MKKERGFILGVALFGLVALSIAGVTSVMLASADLGIVGNERRRHQVEACAESGVDASIAALPDTDWANSVPTRPSNPNASPGTYSKGLYYSGDGLVARAEHYSTTDSGGQPLTDGAPAAKLPPASMADVLIVGENITNMAGWGSAMGTGFAGAMGSGAYRLVSTCKNSAGNVSKEVESVVVYGAGR